MTRRWLAVALVATACGGSTAVLESVPPEQAAVILAEEPAAVLLDIRTPDEYAELRIEGAVNVDFYAPDFAARLGALERDATYVIYCRSGNRTTAALEVFADLGFTSVHAVEGGLLAWVGAGLPAVPG